jgi:hypothetical protein
MGHRRHWRRFTEVAFGLGFLMALAADAQSPAGREALLNGLETSDIQVSEDVACDESGFCLVLWGTPEDTDEPSMAAGVTALSPTGGVLQERIFSRNPTALPVSLVRVGQRFAVFWTEGVGPITPFYQWFDRELEPQGEVIALPELAEGMTGLVDTALVPGGFVQLAAGLDTPANSAGAFLTFTDFAGHELRPPVRVSAETTGEKQVGPGGLAVDLVAGILTVVYSRDVQSADRDVFYRRFSLTGEPLTPDVRVNTFLPHWQFEPAVATAPNGDFVVVWTSEKQGHSDFGIYAQRFTREGVRLGTELLVDQERSIQQRPQVSTDPKGNFVVVWESDPSSSDLKGTEVQARLFRADGRPVGPEVFVNRYRLDDQDRPRVAFAPDGTFVAAWRSNAQVSTESRSDAFARRFSASPGDEPCVVGGGKFWCDTGRTGGEFEVRHGFGGAGSGFGFLGDVDGDGRADPCVYTGGIFRCDTDHEGAAAEVQIAFAVPGASLPLLGDVDGDGREDPCLAKTGGFFCDTRHDGGVAEVRIVFGQPGETPLMGDVDGDGRAEACGFAGGLFRCDTGHDGGKAEWLVRFGRRGDQPLLGDFDGDGRDDPCVFRQGMLLCDTAHDGGAAEGKLGIGHAGDRIVLGNLDGL